MTRSFLIETLRPYRWVVTFIVALSVVASLFDGLSIAILVPLLAQLQQVGGPAPPFWLQWIFDRIGEREPAQLIYASIALVVLASLLKNAFSALSIRTGHWLSTHLMTELRLKSVNTLLRASLAFHNRSRLGDLMDKVIAGTTTAESLIRIGIESTACVVTLLVLIGVLVVLSWQLTLVTIPIALLFALWMRRHTRRLLELGSAVTALNSQVVSSVYEALAGISVIKSYSQEDRHLRRVSEVVEQNRRVEGRRRFQMFWLHPATDLGGTLAMAILVVVALQADGLTTPEVLARLLPFLYVLLRMVPLLKLINGQRAELITLWSQLRLLAELLQASDKGFLSDGTSRFNGLTSGIELKNVSLVYEGQPRSALADVSFRIPAKQTTAILGASGAGKSTVAALLLRLVDPTEGAVLIDGTPLPTLNLASFHAAVGVVSQDTFLFNDTVRYNIAFGASHEADDATVIAAAQQAGAHEFISELASGYDTLLGDRGVRLSGGQRQRIAIARAIIRNPQILILDEATSALDTATERRIHEALRELSRDRTVVIIAHRLSTIEDADWIVELADGRVIRSEAAPKPAAT